MLWLYGNFCIYKRADTFNKQNQCHVTQGGFRSVCARSEPASYKNNEMQEMNVRQKEDGYLALPNLDGLIPSQPREGVGGFPSPVTLLPLIETKPNFGVVKVPPKKRLD